MTTVKEEFGKDLPSWNTPREPEDRNYQKIIELDLDKSEASAIALTLGRKKDSR